MFVAAVAAWHNTNQAVENSQTLHVTHRSTLKWRNRWGVDGTHDYTDKRHSARQELRAGLTRCYRVGDGEQVVWVRARWGWENVGKHHEATKSSISPLKGIFILVFIKMVRGDLETFFMVVASSSRRKGMRTTRDDFRF